MFTTKKKGVSLVCAAMLAIAGTTNVGIASSHADEAGTGLQITYECVNEENAVIPGCGFDGQTSQKTTTDLSTAGIEAAINTAESDAVLKVMQLELQSQGFVLPIDRATIENGTVKVVPAEGLALANATYTFPLDSDQVQLHARVSQIASKASSTLLKFKVGKNGSTVGNTKFTGVGAQQTADGAQAYVPKGGSYQFVYEGEPGTYPETTTGTLTRIRASQAYPNKVHELYEWTLESAATAAKAEVTVGKATSQTVELVVPYREEIYFADQIKDTAAVRDTKEGTKLTLKTSAETGQTGTRYLSATSTTGSFTFNIESNLESQSPTGYDGTFNYFIRGLEARDGAVAPEQQTNGNMDNQQMTAFLKTMWTAHGENNANGWNFGLPEYVPWSQKTDDELKNESNRYSKWLDSVSELLTQAKTKTFDSGPLAGVTVTAKYTDITPVKFTADAVKASDFNPSNAEGNQLKYTLQVTLSNVTRANTVLMLDLFKNERRTGAGGYSYTMDEVYLANHGSIGTEGAPYSRCTYEHGTHPDFWNCLYQRGGLGFQDKREGEFSKGVLGNGWRFAPGGGASGYDASQVNRDGWGSPTFTDNPGIVMLAGGASTSFPMRSSSHVIGRDSKQNGPNSTIATLYFRIQDGFGGHESTDTSREQVTIETVRTNKDDRTIVEENSDKANLTNVGSDAEYVDSDPKQHVYVDAERLHNLFARTAPFPGYANSIYASTAVKVPEAKMPYRVGEEIHRYVQPYSNPLLDVSDLPAPTVSGQGRYKYWQIKYLGLKSNSVFNDDSVISTVHLTPANPIAKYDDVIQSVQFSASDGGRTYRSTRKYTDTYGNPTAKNITVEPVFDETPLKLKQYTLSQQKASAPDVRQDVTFYGLPGLKLVLNNTYNDKTLQEVSYTRATDDYPNNEIQLAESSNAFVLKYDKTDPPTITKLVRTGNGGVEILLTDVNSATTTLTCKYTDSTVTDSTVTDATVHVATTTLTGNNTSTQNKVVFADAVPDGSTFTCTQQAHGITSGESNSKSLPLPKKTVGTAQLDSIDRTNPEQPVLGGKVTVPDPQPDNTDKPEAVEVYNGDEYIGIAEIDSRTGKWSLTVPAAVADAEQLKLVPVNKTNHDLVTSRGQATTNPDRPSAPTIGEPTVATDGTITVPVTKPDNFKEGDILQCRLTDGAWPSKGTSNVNSAGNVVFPAAAEQTSENKSVECRTVRSDLQSAATTEKTLPERKAAPTGVTAVRNEDNIQLSVADPNSAVEENGTGLTPYAVLPKKNGSTGETVAVPFVQGDDGKYVLDLENADLAESLASVNLDQAKKLTAIPVYYQDSEGNQSQAAPVAVPTAISQKPTIAGIDQDAGTLSATGAPASGWVQLVDEDGKVVATVQASAEGKVTFTAGADGVPADAFAAGKKYTVRAVDNQDPTKVTATGPASDQVTVPAAPTIDIAHATVDKDGKVTVPVTTAGSGTTVCRYEGQNWSDAVTVSAGNAVFPQGAEGKTIDCRTTDNNNLMSPANTSSEPAPERESAPAAQVTRAEDDLKITATGVADGQTPYAILPKQGTTGETVAVPLTKDPETGNYVLDLAKTDDPALAQVDLEKAKELTQVPVYTQTAAGSQSRVKNVEVPAKITAQATDPAIDRSGATPELSGKVDTASGATHVEILDENNNVIGVAELHNGSYSILEAATSTDDNNPATLPKDALAAGKTLKVRPVKQDGEQTISAGPAANVVVPAEPVINIGDATVDQNGQVTVPVTAPTPGQTGDSVVCRLADSADWTSKVTVQAGKAVFPAGAEDHKIECRTENGQLSSPSVPSSEKTPVRAAAPEVTATRAGDGLKLSTTAPGASKTPYAALPKKNGQPGETVQVPLKLDATSGKYVLDLDDATNPDLVAVDVAAAKAQANISVVVRDDKGNESRVATVAVPDEITQQPTIAGIDQDAGTLSATGAPASGYVQLVDEDGNVVATVQANAAGEATFTAGAAGVPADAFAAGKKYTVRAVDNQDSTKVTATGPASEQVTVPPEPIIGTKTIAKDGKVTVAVTPGADSPTGATLQCRAADETSWHDVTDGQVTLDAEGKKIECRTVHAGVPSPSAKDEQPAQRADAPTDVTVTRNGDDLTISAPQPAAGDTLYAVLPKQGATNGETVQVPLKLDPTSGKYVLDLDNPQDGQDLSDVDVTAAKELETIPVIAKDTAGNESKPAGATVPGAVPGVTGYATTYPAQTTGQPAQVGVTVPKAQFPAPDSGKTVKAVYTNKNGEQVEVPIGSADTLTPLSDVDTTKPVQLVVVDGAGNRSAPTAVTMPAALDTGVTAVKTDRDTSLAQLTGTAPSGATHVEVLDATGKVIATVPVTAGKFTLPENAAGGTDQDKLPAGALAAGTSVKLRPVKKNTDGTKAALGPISTVTVPSSPTVGAPTVARDGQVTVPVTAPAAAQAGDVLQCRVAGGSWPTNGTSNVTNGKAVFAEAAAGKHVECRTINNGVASPTASSSGAVPEQPGAPTGVAALRSGDQLSVVADDPGAGKIPYVLLPKQGATNGETVAVPLVKDATGKYVLNLDDPANAAALKDVDVAAAKQQEQLPVFVQDQAGNQSPVAKATVPGILPAVTGTATRTAPAAAGEPAQVTVTVTPAEFAKAGDNTVKVKYTKQNGETGFVEVPKADSPVALPADADLQQPIALVTADAQGNLSAATPVAVPAAINAVPEIQQLVFDKSADAAAASVATVKVKGTPGQIVQLVGADQQPLGTTTVGADGLAVFTALSADKIDSGVQARVVNAAQNPTSFGPLTAVREPLAAPTAVGLKLLRDRTGQVQVAAAGVLPQGQKRQCRLVGTESFVDLPHAFTASATDQLECRDVATGTAGVLVTSPVSAAVAVPAPVAAPTAVQAENHNGQVTVTAAKPAQDVTIYALVPSKDDPNKLVEVPLSADGAAAGKVQLDATAAVAAGADLNALAGKPVQLVAKRNDGTSESALAPGSVPATITGSATITGVTREGSPAGITGTYTGNAPFVKVTVGEKLVIAPVQNGSFQVPIGTGDDAFTAAELADGAKLQVVGVNAPEDPTSFGEPSTALTIPAAPAAQSNLALADGTSKVTFAAPAAADEVLRCRIAGETEWFAADAQGVVLVPGGAGQELACQRVVGGVESPVAAVTASKILPQITATGTRTAVADSAVDQVTVTVADAEMNKATAAGASVKAKYTDTSGQVQEIEIPVAQAGKEVVLPAADPTYPVYVYAADAAGNQAGRNQVVLPKAITDAPVLTKVDTASKQPQVAGTVTFNPLADPQAPGETVNAQPTFVRIQDPAGNILAIVPVTYGTGAQANQGTFAADLNSNPQLQEYLAQAAAAGTPAQLQVVGQNAAVKPTAVGPDAPVKQVPAVPRVGAPKWTAAGTVVVPVTSSNAHDQLRCRKAGSTDSFVPVENGTATLTGLAAGDHIACQVANQDGSWQSPVTVGASAVPAQPAAPAVTVTYVPATGAEPASQVITVPADTAADRFYATYVDDQGVTQWVDITPVGALGAVNSDNMLGAKIPAAATGVKVIAVQAGSETAGVIPQVIASPVADLQVHQAGTGAAAQVVITGKVDPEQANAVELVLASGETLVVPAHADGSFEIPAAQLTAADFTSDSNFKVRPVHANRQGELLVPDSYGAETAVTIPEEPAGLEQTTKHDGSVQVTYAGQDVRCRVPGQDWVAGASPLTIAGGAGVALECQRQTNGVQSPVAAVAAQAAPLAPTDVKVARNQQQQVVSIPAAQVPDSATLVVAGKEIPLVHNAATGRFEAVVAANVDLTGAQLYVTDAAGNESAATPVVVPPAIEAAPVVSAVTTSGNQATISGTVEEPAKFVQVLKDGQVLSTVPVTNGRWAVTGVPAAELARLQVRGIDAQDNPLVVGPVAAVGSVATPSFGSQYYDAAGQLHVEVTPAAGGKAVCYLGTDRTTSYPGSPVVLPAGATGELHCKTVLAGKESVAVTAQLQPQPAAPAGVTVAVAAGQVSFHAPAQPAGVKLVLRVGEQEIPFVAAADGGLELNLSAYPDLEPAALAAAQLVALTPVPGSDPVVFSESKPAPVPAVPDFSSLAAEVSSDLDEISGTAQNAEQVRIAYFDESGARQELTTGVDGDQYRVALANAHPGSPVFVTALQGSNTSAPVVKLLPVEITNFVPPTATAAGQLTGKAVSGAKVRITYQTISGEIKAIDVVAENNSFSAEIPQDAAPGTVVSAVVVAYQGTAYENSAAREVQVPVQEAQPQPGAEPLPAQPVQPRQPAAGSTVLKCVATDQWNQLALGLVGVLGAIGAVMWLGENVLPPLELQPPAGLAGQLPLPDLLGGLALPELTLPVVDLEPLGRQLAPVGLAGAIILLLAHNAHSCGSASS